MMPVSKAHSISFTVASSIVYCLWKYIACIDSNYTIISFLISLFMSYSFYKIIYKLILILCKKIKLVKKFILGKYYFEGLWIGKYNSDEDEEYYYEVFEQDLEGMSIKGEAFDRNKNKICSWTIINPIINIPESKFTYYYEMDNYTTNDIKQGYSRATIFYKKYAYKLAGFAIDNCCKAKQEYVSIKIKDQSNLEDWINTEFWNQIDSTLKR